MKEFNILYQKSKRINLTLKKGVFPEGVIWDNEIRRPRTENINRDNEKSMLEKIKC